MGLPYGSIPRKTVPREEQDTAQDYSTLMDFEVNTNIKSMHAFHFDEPLKLHYVSFAQQAFFFIFWN